MSSQRPPTLDPVAAARWQALAPGSSPWLHEEVGRRMAQRLEWIRMAPGRWADWHPARGGLAAHGLVAGRYPKAKCFLLEGKIQSAQIAAKKVATVPRWAFWRGPAPRPEPVTALPDGGVDMLWANMALHASADPQGLMAAWHRALAPQGFLMFSCLGPDTAGALRALYARLGWPPPGQAFTDLHDWGDLLVAAGFAEPVMDMERLTLTWSDAGALLAELRGLGRNLHPGRFGALRGRAWRARLEAELARALAQPDGRLALAFEVIYGHAVKPAPRVALAAQAAISLEQMRGMLGVPPRG